MDIILNADDFGSSASVNAAVLRAHREGVLTSASLMVTGEAVEEAVSLARASPTLPVGLHLVAISGRGCLPPSEIPHLVDGRGFFPTDPVATGLRYFFSKTSQRELARELRAQFDCFASTGLSLAHVNGHLHMQMHPTLFNLIVPLAQDYGAPGIRLPHDDLRAALAFDRQSAGSKITQAVIFGLLVRWARARLRSSPLLTTERVYGFLQSGRMHEDYVLSLLRRLDVATAEFYFHPTTALTSESLGPNPVDLATLLSPAVRQTIEERGIRRVTFPALASERADRPRERMAPPPREGLAERPASHCTTEK